MILYAFPDRVYCGSGSRCSTLLGPKMVSKQTQAGRFISDHQVWPTWWEFRLGRQHDPPNRRHYCSGCPQSWWQSGCVEASCRNWTPLLKPSIICMLCICGSIQGQVSTSTIAPFWLLTTLQGTFVHRTHHLCTKPGMAIGLLRSSA